MVNSEGSVWPTTQVEGRRPFGPRGFITPDRLAFFYGAVISIISLLSALLLSISAAIMLVIAVTGPLISWRTILANPNAKYAYLFAFPATLSMLWSQHPSFTAYYTVQLYLTITLALLLSSSHNLIATINGLFLSHVAFAAVSLVLGQVVPWEDGQYVFVGLSVSKNNYGNLNYFVSMLGIYMAHLGLRNRSMFQFGLGLASILIGIAGVIMSKSAGALVGMGIGFMLYLSCNFYATFPRQRRVLIALVAGGVLLVATVMMVMTWSELYPLMLNLVGKDSNLTGRVDLWNIADKLISHNFWLGLGQYAFWVKGDPLPEAIWQSFQIEARSGFNFHNTYRELLVHVGFIGLMVHVGVYLVLLFRQLSYVFLNPRAEHILFLAVTFSYLIKMPFEAIMPFPPLYSSTIFILAALTVRPPLNRS